MRLISLKLKNYRQFKEAEIEFPDGVIGVVGLNGSGKSSLMEAIAWTLYGNDAARTKKEGIKRVGASPTANVEAQLILEIEDKQYQINRILRGASQTGEGSIISQNKVLADSVRGVDKEINYLFGMDYRSFYTSFFAKQKELNALSVYTPKERKDVILRLLRIDAVDKALNQIRSDTRDEKTKAEILRKTLKDENLVEAQRLAKEVELKKIIEELSILGDKIKKGEIQLAKYKDLFTEERKSFEKYASLDKKRAQCEARLTGLKAREVEIRDDLKKLSVQEAELKKIEKDAEEYLQLEKKNRQLEIAQSSERKTREARLEDLRKKYKEIEENEKKLKPGAPCPTCGQEIKDFAKIKEHFQEEKEKIKSDAETIKKSLEQPYDSEEHKLVRRELENKQAAHDEYPNLLAQVKNKPSLQKDLEKIELEIKSQEDNLKVVLDDLKSVSFDEKTHEKITAQHDQAKSQLDELYEKRNTLKENSAALRAEAESLKKEIEELRSSKRKIEEAARHQEKMNKLVEIMTEYRTHLISRIRPELSKTAGALFAELTDGKYQGLELDEEYEMHIFEGGIKYPLPRFSGGEADLANLCLRLAISQLISQSSNLGGGFIILDEIFGSQDQLRKSAILEALAKLSKIFRQIIVISHVEDIQNQLEYLIEVVEDESGISRVKASA